MSSWLPPGTMMSGVRYCRTASSCGKHHVITPAMRLHKIQILSSLSLPLGLCLRSGNTATTMSASSVSTSLHLSRSASDSASEPSSGAGTGDGRGEHLRTLEDQELVDHGPPSRRRVPLAQYAPQILEDLSLSECPEVSDSAASWRDPTSSSRSQLCTLLDARLRRASPPARTAANHLK